MLVFEVIRIIYYVDILIRITSLLKIKLIYFIIFISYKLRRKEIINYKVSFKNFIVSCIIFKLLNLITVKLKRFAFIFI